MKKISLLAATAITAVSFVEAATCNPSGFFIGLNGGVQMTGARLRFDSPGNSDPADAKLTNINTDFGHKDGDFVAELMAGYNMLYAGVFLVGVHVYIGYNDSSMKHRTTAAQNLISADHNSSGELVHKVKRNSEWFYGIGLRLGYLLNARTILSILLNAERNKWKLTASTINVPGTAADPTTGNESFSKSKSKVSFAPAIEIATFVTKQVSINLRYKCVFGPSITLRNTGSLDSARANTPLRSSTSRTKIRDYQVTIGVSYKTN